VNYIILDLEATCWEGHDKSRNETIEIGALKVNNEKLIVSEFEEFIKPMRFPILSEFCKKHEESNQSRKFNYCKLRNCSLLYSNLVNLLLQNRCCFAWYFRRIADYSIYYSPIYFPNCKYQLFNQ